nr:Myb-like protein [Ipomoea batatas]
MANGLTCTSSFPWIWVVEALASSNQVDASLLIDLVKRIPNISDDLGRSAREMVSFRILENLLIKNNWIKDDSSLSAGPKISFDPSESCEDVLGKILQELSASNVKMPGPQVLKWDIQSFVTYKRSTLPQYALLKMKDMIVKGTDPRLATLKERSGLSTMNQSGNVTSVDGIAVKGTKEMREESNFKCLAQNVNSVASTQENNNREETLPDRDLVLAKKRKSIAADHQGREIPGGGSISENGCDPCTMVTKKCKQSVVFNKEREHIIEYIGREGCSLENESQAGALEESGSPLRQINGNQQQHDCSISEMPQGTNTGGGVKNICIDAAGEVNAHAEFRNSNDAKHPLVQQVSHAAETERNFQHNLSNGRPINESRDSIDCFHGPDPCNDNNEYHEERVEIASKKTAFLSCQCTYSQDSLATTDLRELCMKCNRGGQLLVCSSETCPLVVHDSCLGSIPNFEKDGKFYCPFCAYSRAISEQMKFKKKASLARKDLAAFLRFSIEPLKNVSTKSSRSNTSQSRQDEELCEKGEANSSRNSLRDNSSPECRANTEDKQQGRPSVSPAEGRPPSNDKRISSTSTVPVIFAKDLQENQAEQDTLSPRGGDQQHNETLAITIYRKPVFPFGDPEVSNRDEPCTEVDVERATVPQPLTSLHHQPELSSSTEVEDSSDEENEKHVASKYFIRFNRPEKQCSHPVFPQWKRKRVPWTEEEEEALKEGVAKCKSIGQKNIAWREILEFGGDRFWRGRTPMDLKDKWRNICKGSPNKR